MAPLHFKNSSNMAKILKKILAHVNSKTPVGYPDSLLVPARFTFLQNMALFYSFDLQPLQKNVDDEKCKTTLMQVSLATKNITFWRQKKISMLALMFKHLFQRSLDLSSRMHYIKVCLPRIVSMSEQ